MARKLKNRDSDTPGNHPIDQGRESREIAANKVVFVADVDVATQTRGTDEGNKRDDGDEGQQYADRTGSAESLDVLIRPQHQRAKTDRGRQGSQQAGEAHVANGGLGRFDGSRSGGACRADVDN